MVKLPTKEELGKPVDLAPRGGIARISTPDASGINVGRGLANLGAGIGDAAATIGAAVREDREKRDALELMRIDSEFKIRSMERSRSLIDTDQDYTTWTSKNTEASKKDIDELTANISDPYLREKAKIQFGLHTANDNNSLASEATRRDRIVQHSELVTALDKDRRRFLEAKTPEEKIQARADIDGKIRLARSKGLIDDKDVLKLYENFDQGLLKEAAEILYNEDPDALGDKLIGLPAKTNAIMGKLITDYGLTPEVAAGIVGNFAHETGGFIYHEEIDPTVPGSRGGAGWAQWTGPRRVAFDKWVAEHPGMDPRSDEANYGFFKHEVETKFPGLMDKLKTAESPEEAMFIFEQVYENSGVKNYRSRYEHTTKALQAWKDGGGSYNEFAELDPVVRSEYLAKVATVKTGRLKVGSPYEAQLKLEQPNAVWNPMDGDDRKRQDALFEADNGPQRLTMRDQAFFDEEVIGMLETTKMIAPSVRGVFEGMIGSKDPTGITQTWVLSNMEKLERANPVAFARDMGKENLDRVLTYRNKLAYVQDPKLLAEEFMVSEDPAVTESRKKFLEEGRDLVSAIKTDEILAAYDPGFWYAQPSGPPDLKQAGRLRVEFDRLFAEQYAKTGDPVQAKDNALKLLKTVWNNSEVTGERVLMRFAPEQYNPVVNDSHEWLGKQFQGDMRRLGYGDQRLDIQSDEETEADLAYGRPPSYAILRMNDGGAFEPVINNQTGKIIRYRFDPNRAAREIEDERTAARKAYSEGKRRFVPAAKADAPVTIKTKQEREAEFRKKQAQQIRIRKYGGPGSGAGGGMPY